jgi:hypothetical protein
MEWTMIAVAVFIEFLSHQRKLENSMKKEKS